MGERQYNQSERFCSSDWLYVNEARRHRANSHFWIVNLSGFKESNITHNPSSAQQLLFNINIKACKVLALHAEHPRPGEQHNSAAQLFTTKFHIHT